MVRDKWQNASYHAHMSSQREEGTAKRKPCSFSSYGFVVPYGSALNALPPKSVPPGWGKASLLRALFKPAGLGLAARIGHRKKIGTPEISVRGNCLLVICYCRADWGMQSLSVYSATPHKNRLLSPGKKGECVVGTQNSLCQVSSLCDPQSELLPPS